MIRIEPSKRRKDRYAMLSPRLLDLLRDRWLVCRSRAGCSRAVIRSADHHASAYPRLP